MVKIWLDLGLMRLFIIVLEQPYYNKVFCDNMTKERYCWSIGLNWQFCYDSYLLSCYMIKIWLLTNLYLTSIYFNVNVTWSICAFEVIKDYNMNSSHGYRERAQKLKLGYIFIRNVCTPLREHSYVQ